MKVEKRQHYFKELTIDTNLQFQKAQMYPNHTLAFVTFSAPPAPDSSGIIFGDSWQPESLLQCSCTTQTSCFPVPLWLRTSHSLLPLDPRH